jgi:hypothetical protein
MVKKLPINPFQQWTRRLLRQRADRGLPISAPFLAEIWESLLGEELGEHTRPLRLEQGHLEVAVTSDLWRHELERHRHELLRRLNLILPDPLSQLTFHAERARPTPRAPRADAPRAPRLGQMPLPEARLLEEVEDDELRTLLTRIRRLERGRKSDLP